MILRIQHLTIKNYHIFAYLETAREEKKAEEIIVEAIIFRQLKMKKFLLLG